MTAENRGANPQPSHCRARPLPSHAGAVLAPVRVRPGLPRGIVRAAVVGKPAVGGAGPSCPEDLDDRRLEEGRGLMACTAVESGPEV